MPAWPLRATPDSASAVAGSISTASANEDLAGPLIRARISGFINLRHLQVHHGSPGRSRTCDPLIRSSARILRMYPDRAVRLSHASARGCVNWLVAAEYHH